MKSQLFEAVFELVVLCILGGGCITLIALGVEALITL